MSVVECRESEQQASVACDHCGLPVPRSLVDASAILQFCCQGCRTVHDIIDSHGLEDYYRIKASVPGPRKSAEVRGKKYSAFDGEHFQQKYCCIRSDDTRAIELRLEGVHCVACMWLVERLPRLLDGVQAARLSLRDSIVRLVWDPGKVALSEIARTLDKLGYAPHPATHSRHDLLRRRDEQKQLVPLGIAGICAGNIMLLALALYAGDFSGIERDFAEIFRWLSAGLGVVSLTWPGSVFFRGAWTAIQARVPNLDLPIAIALGTGGIAGLANVFLGRGDIYFDSLSMLVFLLLVGRWFQFRQQRWADETVGLLARLTPVTCRIVLGGTTTETTVDALTAGDLVEVLSGDVVPADGKVVEGNSSTNNSLLTGESAPELVGPGDKVSAGTQNIGGPIRLRVTSTGQQTRIGQLMQLVEQGVREKSPSVQFAERALRWFIPAMVLAATATFVAWCLLGGIEPAVDHSVALLIVACPCALGLATPLTFAVAIGMAAKNGILIKNATALEALTQGGRILVDKTGTLTRGQPTVVDWIGPDWLKPVVARLESHSTHPIANSLVDAFSHLEYPQDLPPIRDIVEQGDGGLRARLGGQEILIGSPGYLDRNQIEFTPPQTDTIAARTYQGETTIGVAVDGKLVVLIILKDQLEPSSKDVIVFLKDHGWDVSIVSGDSYGVVRKVATQLGIKQHSVFAEVLPEQKLSLVKSCEAQIGGKTVMVGDGVNDAAALAAADVGIAVRGGAEASLAAADVYLCEQGLISLIQLLRIARRTKRVVIQNLTIALGYNAIAVSLASLGFISPLFAAVLMPLSSITVLASAFSVKIGGR